jgi:hypothetical protein
MYYIVSDHPWKSPFNAEDRSFGCWIQLYLIWILPAVFGSIRLSKLKDCFDWRGY